MSYESVSYWLDGMNIKEHLMMYLKLLDIFDFKDDIVIFFRRLPKDWETILNKQTVACDIIKDSAREDRSALYFKFLNSNMILYDFLSQMDDQTEWTYYPNINQDWILDLKYVDFENFLKRDFVTYQINYDGDYGLHICWRKDNQTDNKDLLHLWENLLSKKKYKYIRR